jgi:anti-sigma factor RsiW
MMSDDTRRILDLVAKGKVTVDEAEQLMQAIGASPPQASTAAAPPAPDTAERLQPRWVRINVHKTAREGKHDKDVNIRVPIAIVKSGMRLGALIPGLAGDQVAARMREKGLDVDFSKLDAATIEAVLKELGDTNIEIESGKSQVRITCE